MAEGLVAGSGDEGRAPAAAAAAGRGATGLLAACDDRRLFGFGLWPRQRELLASVERGPRLHVWALGRRSGKTTLAALVGLHTCLFRPDIAACVRPGERFYAVGVATNLRQARLFVSAARSVVERSRLLSSRVVSMGEDEIVFSTGGVLTAFPCSSRGGRGWPIAALLMDEAAHFLTETEGPAVAERVWEALVPSTAQFGDLARVIVASTPYGSSGLFAELYQRAAVGELADAVAVRARTAEINPTISASFLEQERARDPEGFRAEYEADFLGGGTSFFDPERLDGAVAERAELTPDMGTGWVAGLDPAFSSDPFGLALVGRAKDDPSRLVLGVARAWKPGKRKLVSFGEKRAVEDKLLDEVAEVCKRYGARVVTDQHASRAVCDYLARKGLSVSTRPITASSKTAAFTETRARVYSGGLELYPNHDLLAELRRVRTHYAAGSSSVVTPRVSGSHCDMAIALVLATFEHRGGGSAFPMFGGPHVVPAFDVPKHWTRLEALAGGALTGWLSLAVDPAGNLVVVDEACGSWLPSEVAQHVRGKRAGSARCFAPPEFFGGREGRSWRQWGAPSSVVDEFADAGISLIAGNDDRGAGFMRTGELLRVLDASPLPEWHPRAGEPGCPRLFVTARCEALIEQLRAAPLEADDEPLPGTAVSRRWESMHGPLVAALRLAVMSRPAPSKEPDPFAGVPSALHPDYALSAEEMAARGRAEFRRERWAKRERELKYGRPRSTERV